MSETGRIDSSDMAFGIGLDGNTVPIKGVLLNAGLPRWWPSRNEWIKCSERMPTEADANIHGYVQAYDPHSKTSWTTTYSKICPDFTHWMPLPAPPASENSEADVKFEQWSEGIDVPRNRDTRDSFVAGYEAGKAAR